MARRVVDAKLLRLLKLWLTAEVEHGEDPKRVQRSGGSAAARAPRKGA